MDDFRRGLLAQMGENRSRARRQRAPWLYGLGALPLAAASVWLLEAFLLAGGLVLAGWGLTTFRLSRINGRERDRLAGQALVLSGLVLTLLGAWRTGR